jgi:dihydroxyacid dehydratase/phosphogluconate dehydratase
MSKVPRLLSFDPVSGRSAPGLAAESDAGGNSGIDTLMRTLSEKRFIDDRAPTLDGAWMYRIMDARSANGRYFHSTMTPSSPNSGLARVQGNLCTSGLAKLSASAVDYDQKIYLADFYLGVEELVAALRKPRGPLERLRKKVTRDDLVKVLQTNGAGAQTSNGDLAGIVGWEKKRVWSYMAENGLLRVMFFVGGEGPKASGMPEIDIDRDLGPMPEGSVISTDGRIGFNENGVSVVHMTPEAIAGGAIASVRTGDWIYLNARKGEFNLVTATRNAAGFRPLRETELARRPEKHKRILELHRRRTSFLPSVRSVLDSVSSAAEGLSPSA